MLQEKRFKKLRSRAEKILETTRTQQNDSLTKEYVQELVREIVLYQIELELQDEELQKSQKELKESRNKYAALFELAPLGYFMLGSNGSIIEINQVAANILGVNKQTLINKNLCRYVSTDSSVAYIHYLSQLTTSNIRTCELKFLKKHGPISDAQLAGKIIINPRTLDKEILLMVKDITDHEQDEKGTHTSKQKMAYLDRVSSMGELTSAMAHEINQPLAIISNYVHGCIHRLEKREIAADLLLQSMLKMAAQLQRISEIMLRMRNFSLKGKINYEPVCLDIIIQESLKLIDHEILEYPVKINYKPIKNPLIMMIDRIQLQQVILNLVRNSIEAMKDAITTEPSIILELNQVSKKQVEINILDNGPGIPKQILHRLFDPYFTTKPYGIGLGLAISRTIIESHAGKLLAESSPIYGACFKIILPIKKPEELFTSF